MEYVGEPIVILTEQIINTLKNYQDIMIKKYRVYHNDLVLENVMRNTNGELFIIDFEKSTEKPYPQNTQSIIRY